MMNKRQTSPRGIVKYALILPLIFSIMLLANVRAVAVYTADGDKSTVTGTVRDEAGYPVKGASVILRGSTTGTMTDGDGRYSLSFEPGENNVLIFSRIGMETTERQAADKLNVVMKESVTQINAVDVTGYPEVPVQSGTQTPDEDEPFVVVEKMPKFQGGDHITFYHWVASSIRYPKDAYDKGVQGRVVLSFIVEEDGSVSNVEVIGKVAPSLDAEAVRVVSSSPRWEPGTQREVPVRVKFNMPVDFTSVKDVPVSSHIAQMLNRQQGDPVPLFILDGHQVDEEQVMKLVTDDIITITVLKDPTATDIYGEKAANGVVIIETKAK